ncbi:uncharacterized protein B0H64DRAFT_374015 [Chaetomium fimeti]|uniref:Uncharacterized protein n=1 Tax=Chaetomium fimeti TaxID=1854472 RepID=A0AAE0HGE6_9PEZI|nr:hypothetical protein B0H64DRAFT_374015 [Chaetomium fimeti]
MAALAVINCQLACFCSGRSLSPGPAEHRVIFPLHWRDDILPDIHGYQVPPSPPPPQPLAHSFGLSLGIHSRRAYGYASTSRVVEKCARTQHACMQLGCNHFSTVQGGESPSSKGMSRGYLRSEPFGQACLASLSLSEVSTPGVSKELLSTRYTPAWAC